MPAPMRETRPSPFIRNAPRRTILLRLNQKTCDFARLAACCVTGSSPLRIRKSSAVWLAKILLLHGDIVFESAMAVQVVGGDVQDHGDHGDESSAWSPVESWRPRAPTTRRQCSDRPASITGRPILPPTSVFSPAARKISPHRVVVVVLPLEPVMASTLPLKKARGQFQFANDGQAQGAHLSQFRRDQGHAGETTIRSWRRKVSSP